jgi:group I intron endonuclease
MNILKRRDTHYKKLNCKKQIKLYNSLKFYGFENHTFDIIEECPISYLDELETWWKLFYNSVEDGLNGGYWDKGGGPKSQETKDKISKANKGKNTWTKGRIFTEEHKQKISINKKGKGVGLKRSEEQKQRMKDGRFGPILQYDLEGNFIREWFNQKIACDSLGIRPSALNNNLKSHPQYTCGGFRWKYKNK